MSTKSIIQGYEAQRSFEHEEWKHGREREEKHKHHNSSKIEEHLHTYVLPSLTQAKAQILECGYPCEIEKGYSTNKPAHLDRLTLQTSRHKIPHARNFPCALSFLCHSDSLTFEIETTVDDIPIGKDSPLPLEKLTATLIESRVETFLKGVFHM